VKSNPDKIACVIIDGMDQMKLLIPKMLNQAKAYASAWRLKTHLTGNLDFWFLLDFFGHCRGSS
jgi:hypothetical protein